MENKYEHFICFRFYPISKCNAKNLTDRLIEYDFDLQTLIESDIITGNDLGYEVRLKDGHIEVDAINSGARATYYIYAYDDGQIGSIKKDSLVGDIIYNNDNLILLIIYYYKSLIISIPNPKR